MFLLYIQFQCDHQNIKSMVPWSDMNYIPHKRSSVIESITGSYYHMVQIQLMRFKILKSNMKNYLNILKTNNILPSS